jgi:hypothetical protein
VHGLVPSVLPLSGSCRVPLDPWLAARLALELVLCQRSRCAAGYDVWAKTIEALSDIGYDPTNMVAMPYDWRLSIPNLELRDGYFTKLRLQVRYHSRPAAHFFSFSRALAPAMF